MSIDAALRTELKDDATIAGLVSTRIRLSRADQRDTIPYITINRLSGSRFHNATAASGMAIPTFQIDCWGATPILAIAVADAVREAIDGFKGTMGSGGNTANVRTCWLEGEPYLHEPQKGDGIGAHGVAMTFDIMHKETVPTFS